MTYRHEWKHEISRQDCVLLRQRLSLVAQLDPNAVEGSYVIRSLYFDNLEDKALLEKLNGVNRREKFRIRYYNGDLTTLHLEKKSRLNGLGTKFHAPLTPAEGQRIVDGDIAWMADCTDRPLLQELYSKMLGQGLQPKTIVDYTREPFIYPPGNVRVTLDYDIRTGLRSTDFLNPDCPTIPAGNAAAILEVKWDAFLPDLIRDIVQMPGRHTAPFSKYAACRCYC